jgi:hypothetical protein
MVRKEQADGALERRNLLRNGLAIAYGRLDE